VCVHERESVGLMAPLSSCCSVLQCNAVRCSVIQCVVVCVAEYVAV